MAQFMLLLHETIDADAPVPSAEEIQSIIAEYVAWREAVADRGQLIGGEKLADEGGKWLVPEGHHTEVTDGPYTEAKEVLGGYFAIQADDYEAAVELAKGCPHLKYGGRIEVRQIDEVH